MIFDGVPDEIMIYGKIFSLSNRIQTIGDVFFSDITTKQHFLLMTLDLFVDRHPSLKEVADIIGCSYQNVKKIAVSLEKKGYLRIEHDIRDKRKYNLVTTDKTQAISNHTGKAIDEFLSALFQGVTQEQKACILTALSQMDGNLQKLNREDSYANDYCV